MPEQEQQATEAYKTNSNQQATSQGMHTLIFTIQDYSGSLSAVLNLFKANSISLTKIESRPSKTFKWDYDFFVEFECEISQLDKVLFDLDKLSKNVKLISQELANKNIVPWFPRKMSDLDSFAEKILDMSDDLSVDHPGFKDLAYRARRAEITRIAKSYKSGQKIPKIEYTKEENETWSRVYSKLTEMFPKYACKEHQYVFPLLIQHCNYSPKEIPQLQDVSDFLYDCTGFTLRPVMGLLSSRDFLNGLAFRVFHSTQYIRHSKNPFYTPEPDVCHELLGHVPLFADPDFADFSQEIGLCSLGASDQDIEKLATIYWFTIEFGLCKQDGQLKAYGAGLLSSFGELEYCLSDKPQVKSFEVDKVSIQKYPITSYQPLYFSVDSFKEMQEKIREFNSTLSRKFSVRYNPLNCSIQVLDSKDSVVRYANNIKSDLQNLVHTLKLL